MHIMEGYLPATHAVGWGLASAPFVAYGAYRIRRVVREHPEYRKQRSNQPDARNDDGGTARGEQRHVVLRRNQPANLLPGQVINQPVEGIEQRGGNKLQDFADLRTARLLWKQLYHNRRTRALQEIHRKFRYSSNHEFTIDLRGHDNFSGIVTSGRVT